MDGDHILHLEGFSDAGPKFRLECHSIEAGRNCPATEPDLPGQCAAISWLENCDWDDLLSGDFEGRGPYMATIKWPHPEDAPRITAAKEEG